MYSMTFCFVLNLSALKMGDCLAIFIWMPIWLLVYEEIVLFEVFENFGLRKLRWRLNYFFSI